MTELEDLKQRISVSVKRHYETEEGKAHRKKLSRAMKRKWRELKREAADVEHEVVVRMPPKKKYTVELEIKNIRKAKPPKIDRANL